MFGILLCKTRTREFSKFARNKLLARTGCDTGITKTETGTVEPIGGDRVPIGRDVDDHVPPTHAQSAAVHAFSLSFDVCAYFI